MDGNYFAFRAYYGFTGSSAGPGVNAVYGFGSFLIDALKTFDPERIAVIFDAPGDSFRNELYSDYKAQRPPVPEELLEQLPLMEELLQCLGIPSISLAGVEGDDVLGSLSFCLVDQGWSVGLLSADKDLFQLLRKERITLFRSGTRGSGQYQRVDGRSFSDKFGFSPGNHVDYLALTGDRADNVPGVRGIGPKNAGRLIRSYGTLEKLYEDISSLPVSLGRKLQSSREEAFLSKELVTIRTDLDLQGFLPEACCMNTEELDFFCRENHLQSLYARCMDCTPSGVHREVSLPF